MFICGGNTFGFGQRCGHISTVVRKVFSQNTGGCYDSKVVAMQYNKVATAPRDCYKNGGQAWYVLTCSLFTLLVPERDLDPYRPVIRDMVYSTCE